MGGKPGAENGEVMPEGIVEHHPTG
jgi:hypothetical protein